MILITGGAGYIGSHFVTHLVEKGETVLVIDNLQRGHREAVHKSAQFEQADILDFESIKNILQNYNIKSIVHFAAFAYVGESVENPKMYYTNNVAGSLNLIKAAVETGVEKFVFSSTCSIYGNPLKVPISEEESAKPINPYAHTKLMIENMLADFGRAYGLKYAALRYFNAAGADSKGRIGESHDPEPHLIPIVLQAALGKREKIFVFGDDYDTADGTCIRDYIHIEDLADAHARALKYLDKNESDIFNLGTGKGYSVLEIIRTVEEITGKKLNVEITERRAGDPAVLVAENKKAKDILGWVPKHDLKSIIETAYNWHSNQKF